jgi:hypothetical protein
MRALLGPLNPLDYRPAVGDLDGLDILCFDRRGADIAFDAATEPLETLWSRLPQDFTPDCLIWWSPEYTLLPEGIERCPVPSIAVLGDWNLGVWSTAPLLEAFDWVVTDACGVETFRPQLDVPVDRWPAFAFDQTLHRRGADVARDIDVLFVGSMNHDVQIERMPWLARLARLSPRYRVLLASGVYGEPYAALLNRARIVWNRSIRGELNMRAYEAPACGAVLFMERENREVRDLFVDGESCVLYGEEDLETRLAGCLRDPERLARIAQAGWRRVQAETYRRHLETLLDRARHVRRGPRTFATLPAWRRDHWLGVHALTVSDGARASAAFRHFTRATSRTDDPGTVVAALGAVAIAVDGPPGERLRMAGAASRLYQEAVALHPEDVVTHMNAAWLAGVLGRTEAARDGWLTARALLKTDVSLPLDRPPAPFGFDRFRVEWERAAVVAEARARAAALRPLLRARVAAALADLERDDESRLAWWDESVVHVPGIEGNVARRAAALAAVGRTREALAAHQAALAANPFDASSRLAAAGLAQVLGDEEAVETLRADGACIAAATPQHADALAGLASLMPVASPAR